MDTKEIRKIEKLLVMTTIKIVDLRKEERKMKTEKKLATDSLRSKLLDFFNG